MYEVWLMMNILWELALGVWPLVLGAAVLWAVLMATALARTGTSWAAGLPLAVVAGLVVAAVAAWPLLAMRGRRHA